jgi:hypothetical protein
MLPDLNKLTDNQVEQLVRLLARFAAWQHYREAFPDAAPLVTFTQANILAEDYEEVALDYLATGHAMRDRAGAARPHAATGPRLFEPGE